jgi:Flp pilus assembly CpaF family ATPase
VDAADLGLTPRHVDPVRRRDDARRLPAALVIPDITYLRVPLPDVGVMQTRLPNLEAAGEIPQRRLVKEALRMRPSRILMGEARIPTAAPSV